jgi:hypothetical protein
MKRILILLLIIVVGGTGGALLYHFRSGQALPAVRGQQTEAVTEKIYLTVEDGTQKNGYEVNYRGGMTALEATKLAVAENMTTKGEGTMAYVTGIAGRNASESKHEFWEFLVNGKQAEVGAGTYIVQKKDIIVWRVSNY